MPFTATRMNLQIIILSEVSKIKTNTILYHLFVESKIGQKHTYETEAESRHREQTCGCHRGRGQGRKDWEFGIKQIQTNTHTHTHTHTYIHTGQINKKELLYSTGFPGGSEVKASASNAGDPDSIPGSGRSPREGNGNPLQYSCLENPMDEEAWQATVHGVVKSRTRLSNFTHSLYSTGNYVQYSVT